jgi:methylmalonyl-CoA mutase N-terminal domain/subunit
VEALTDRMEQGAEAYFEKIEALGGVIPAIEQGFFQREIAEAAYRYQIELDAKRKTIVGVNDFVEADEEISIPILQISPEVESKQRKRMGEVRASRNNAEVQRCLDELLRTARDGGNLLPSMLACTRAYATLGEMCQSLTEVFGVHEEAAVF